MAAAQSRARLIRFAPERAGRLGKGTGAPIGEVPLAAVVPLITDTVVHSWDIGHALGSSTLTRTGRGHTWCGGASA